MKSYILILFAFVLFQCNYLTEPSCSCYNIGIQGMKLYNVDTLYSASGKIESIYKYFKDHKQNKHRTAYIYYSSGKIKYIQNYCNEMLHGVFKELYENGNIKLHEYYCNDIEIGGSKLFKEDGTLHQITIYDKDGKEKEAEVYFRDEILKLYWKNGQQLDGKTFLDKNYNILSYTIMDSLKNFIFTRKYNEKGEVIRETGFPIYEEVLNKTVYHVSDTFSISFKVGLPYNCFPKLSYRINDNKSVPIKSGVNKQNYNFFHKDKFFTA